MPRPPRSPIAPSKRPIVNECTKLVVDNNNGSSKKNHHNHNGAQVPLLLQQQQQQQQQPYPTYSYNQQHNPVPSHSRNSSLSSIESGYCSTTTDTYDGSDDYQHFKFQHLVLDAGEGEYEEPLKAHHDHGASTTPPRRQSLIEQAAVWRSRLPRADPAASQFALRMALLLTVSGLFVLPPQVSWPAGEWILVSVLFVSWFPAMDAASVVEKIFQRLMGTFVGATLGVSCGFASLFLFRTRTSQAAFLGACMFVGNFAIIFLAGQCKVGGAKVIRKYAYATILCVLTFCICMLPFSADADPKWFRGVMRIVNVVIGCLLGALGAVAICPKSTSAVLHDKTARQVKLCGEAADAVLTMAADHFAGKVTVLGLADELANAPLETTVRWSLRRVNSGNLSEPSLSASKNADVALQKFEDAMEDWKASKMLFPLTKFDPFHMKIHGEVYASKTALNQAIARTLARSMRIQTTIVMLDGMVRHDTDYNLTRSDLRRLRLVGSQVQAMLAVPLIVSSSDQAALALLTELGAVRKKILLLSQAASQQDDLERSLLEQRFRRSLVGGGDSDAAVVDDDDDAGRGIPKFASDANDNARFFLQLVEHLILRSLRLYQAWKQVQVQASKVKDNTLQSWTQADHDTQILNAKAGDSLRSLIGM